MLEFFTYVDISPDFVDFGGQKIHRPDGIGDIQWLCFWEMARDCQDTIPDIEDMEREIEDLRHEIDILNDEIDDLQEKHDDWKGMQIKG